MHFVPEHDLVQVVNIHVHCSTGNTGVVRWPRAQNVCESAANEGCETNPVPLPCCHPHQLSQAFTTWHHFEIELSTHKAQETATVFQQRANTALYPLQAAACHHASHLATSLHHVRPYAGIKRPVLNDTGESRRLQAGNLCSSHTTSAATNIAVVTPQLMTTKHRKRRDEETDR